MSIGCLLCAPDRAACFFRPFKCFHLLIGLTYYHSRCIQRAPKHESVSPKPYITWYHYKSFVSFGSSMATRSMKMLMNSFSTLLLFWIFLMLSNHTSFADPQLHKICSTLSFSNSQIGQKGLETIVCLWRFSLVARTFLQAFQRNSLITGGPLTF